jgi:outer membrane protein OmpA-like peptidoglycan-associated protein
MLQTSKKLLIASLMMSIGLSGCSTLNPYTGESQVSDTAKGIGLGTAGGALIGALADGGRGALIGGAVGAVAGGLIGHSLDQQDVELRKRLVGTGVQVKKIGNSIQLLMASDVTFATNQSSLRTDFYPTLNSVATVLKKYDNTSITITGYTDNTGGDTYNQELSEQRAGSVGAYLAYQGISANRIFTQGLGKRNPIASNASNAGRAMNRRVVITLRPLS